MTGLLGAKPNLIGDTIWGHRSALDVDLVFEGKHCDNYWFWSVTQGRGTDQIQSGPYFLGSKMRHSPNLDFPPLAPEGPEFLTEEEKMKLVFGQKKNHKERTLRIKKKQLHLLLSLMHVLSNRRYRKELTVSTNECACTLQILPFFRIQLFMVQYVFGASIHIMQSTYTWVKVWVVCIHCLRML